MASIVSRLAGKYNVPYGYRKKPFLNENVLRTTSERLKSSELFSGHFTMVKQNIKANDLVS